jgi:hypothetical protein
MKMKTWRFARDSPARRLLAEENKALRFTTRGPQQSGGQHEVRHGGMGTSRKTEGGVNKTPDRHAMHIKAS